MEFSKRDTNIAKGVALILMLFHHCFMSASRYEGQIIKLLFISEKTLNKIANSSVICVSIFVFLTGYGMTVSYKKQNSNLSISDSDITSITVNRLLKLISGFMFVCILLHIYSFTVLRKNMYSAVYGEGARSVLYFLVDMFGLSELFKTPQLIATFWYMSLAIIIIVILPMMLKAYKALGLVSFLLLTGIISAYMFGSGYNFCKVHLNLFAFAIGIVSADKKLFTKLREVTICNNTVIDYVVQFVIYSFLIVIVAAYRYMTLKTGLLPIWNGILSFLIVFFVFNFLARIPIVSSILKTIGLYSMNAFLIHNFIRVRWYYDFTYSFHYPILITIVLLAISVTLSVMIELLKKLTGFNLLTSSVSSKLMELVKGTL